MMQLVLDVGNTDTVIGVIDADHVLRAHWRRSTGEPRSSAEYADVLGGLLDEEGITRSDLTRVVIGSVVPSATETLRPAIAQLGLGPTHSIGSDSPLPITLAVEEPGAVGIDRIVNTLAAVSRYRRDTLVVDLGTATTFDVVTVDAVFQGGVIAPGVSMGLEWLAKRTAKLPAVVLAPPEQVIGRRTEECIRSGIFYSAVDAVEGIVRRILEEWGRPDAYVVATGGFAPIVAPRCGSIHTVEPFLTLYGLALAGDHVGAAQDS